MRYQSALESDLARIVEAVSRVEGVLALILFGSAARGEHDRHSDYDLLVIFNEEKTMWRNWEKLYRSVGKLRLLIHLIPKSLKEFTEKTEPTFLSSVLQQGKLLYLRYPLEAPAYLATLKPAAIVIYSLSDLEQREKMRVIYSLYGRKTKRGRRGGIINEIGGIKLGEGCILIEEQHIAQVLDVLEQRGVEAKALKLCIAEEELRALEESF